MGGGAVTPDGPLYGLPEAMDSVDISVDGGVSLTRRTKLVTMDGANKSAVASTMPCASGAYAYVTSAPGALAQDDFAASCTHFAAVSKAAPTAQRTAGRMMTGLTSSGVPNIWFFSDQPTVCLLYTSNDRVTLMDDCFPVLQPGANIISWTGDGVTKVTVAPRWRDL